MKKCAHCRIETFRTEPFPLCPRCENASFSHRVRFKNFNLVSEKFGDPRYIDLKLMFLLQAARETIGKPFIIHTAYATEGHAPRSLHYTGQAVDLHVPRLAEKDNILKLYRMFRTLWPGGLGIYPDWNTPGVHLDTGKRRSWMRTEIGGYTQIAPEKMRRRRRKQKRRKKKH